MRNFFHLARNSFRECLREPAFVLMLFAALFVIGLFPTMTMFVFQEQAKLVVDSAMATTLVFSLVAAVLCATQTVTRELRNGTALLLLAKPVTRWTFLHAKLAGVLAALTLFVFACNAATLVSLRVAKDQFRLDFPAFYGYYLLMLAAMGYGAWRNYYAHKSFAAAAATAIIAALPGYVLLLSLVKSEGAPPFPHEVLPAMVLLFFAAWAMGAITITLSTRLDLTANLACAATLFLLGLVTDYLRGLVPDATIYQAIADLFYAAIPNWQFFWVADALAAKQPIPLTYLGWAGLYILLYLLLCGLVANALFSGREVGDEAAT